MDQLLSTGQVARLLGLQAHRIEYAHASGQLSEPRLKFMGKRVFTADDVWRVAQHFGLPFEVRLNLTGDDTEGGVAPLPAITVVLGQNTHPTHSPPVNPEKLEATAVSAEPRSSTPPAAPTMVMGDQKVGDGEAE